MVHALRLVPFVDEEPDTVVIDPEDPQEADVMQVLVLDEDGVWRWHRWMAGSNGSQTACNHPVDNRYTRGTRYPVCKGVMCERCFTVEEIVKAELANLAERRRNT